MLVVKWHYNATNHNNNEHSKQSPVSVSTILPEWNVSCQPKRNSNLHQGVEEKGRNVARRVLENEDPWVVA